MANQSECQTSEKRYWAVENCIHWTSSEWISSIDSEWLPSTCIHHPRATLEWRFSINESYRIIVDPFWKIILPIEEWAARTRLLTHAAGYWLDSPTTSTCSSLCCESIVGKRDQHDRERGSSLEQTRVKYVQCSFRPQSMIISFFLSLSLYWLDTVDKLGEHAENENFQPLCHSIRLALNSVITRLKQKSESALIANDAVLNESIQSLTKSLAQLTEMLRKD